MNLVPVILVLHMDVISRFLVYIILIIYDLIVYLMCLMG